MNAPKLHARRLTVPLRWICFAVLFAIVTPRGFAQPLNIVTQPQSQTNSVGSPVTFSVSVSSISYLTYQWRFNGTNLPVATNDYYTIPSVQVTHAGDYSVAVTNSFGGTISSNATLTVLESPVITTQPVSINRAQGTAANFSVVAAGASPLSYQWRFNTTSYLPDATNSTLPITNVQAWQAGAYSVLVENSYGITNSSNALLTVILPAGSPACWGNTAEPASTVPVGYSIGHKAVAAGGAHTLGLKTNSVVTGWGDNSYGQLGLAGLSNVTAIAAGLYHSLALTNGSVVAAGDNSYGQTDVPPPLGDVTAIAAGAQHSLALLNDATVVAWGNNLEGETNVPPDLTNVVRIAAGYYHNLALKRDGTVVCWGNNTFTECDPPGGLDGVIAIAAGNGFSLALRTNGAVVAWGDNSFGQLAIPAVLLTGTGAAAIAAGGAHCLALREGGQVIAWGQNDYGATTVPPPIFAITAIAGGSNHSVVLKGSSAPVIACQPWSQRVDPGSNVVFSAFAVGNGPLRYQWRFNGTNLLGATNKWFAVPNAQSANAGPYRVVVTNTTGSVTSSIATLTVVGAIVPPVWSNTSFDNAGFHARLTGTPGPYIIETSPNLHTWAGVLTTNIPPAGFIDLLDATATRNGSRYYRAHTP